MSVQWRQSGRSSSRRLLAGLVVVVACMAQAGCEGATPLTVWASVSDDQAKRFSVLLTAYGQSHGISPVWRNLGSDELAQAVTQPDKSNGPDWLLLSDETARLLPEGTLKPFLSQLSPDVTTTIHPTFAAGNPDMAIGKVLPLVARPTATLLNRDLLKQGMKQPPKTLVLGDIGIHAFDFHQKTKRYLFLPALGNPDNVLALLAAHGLIFYPASGGKWVSDERLLMNSIAYWSTFIQQGVMPRDCLQLDETQALQRFMRQEAASVLLDRKAAGVLDKSQKPAFEIVLAPFLTGGRRVAPMQLTGLYRVTEGRVDQDAKGLASYLLTNEAQWTMAETWQSAPCVATAAATGYRGSFRPDGPVLDQFWRASFTFVQNVGPVLPADPRHDRLAQALRQALIEAADGRPMKAVMPALAQQLGVTSTLF